MADETQDTGRVGAAFDVYPGEHWKLLEKSAKISSEAEDVLFRLWLRYDPMSPAMALKSSRDYGEKLAAIKADKRARILEAEAKIKDPAKLKTAVQKIRKERPKIERTKLPDYRLKDTPDGETPTKIARNLCPGVHSCCYDGVANYVTKTYLRYRMEFLVGRRSLPRSKNIRLRMHKKGVWIRKDQARPGEFQIGLSLQTGGQAWMGLGLRRASKPWRDWLEKLATETGNPCNATVTLRGKQWSVGLARPTVEDDREKVVEPVAGRMLQVTAPMDQETFLMCEVQPKCTTQPIRMRVEDANIIREKLRYDAVRRTRGRHWAQGGGRHGHGRVKARSGIEQATLRYERRKNDFIEQRSAAIVSFAVKMRCSELHMENLVDREPTTLRMGSFDYYRFITRVQQKAQAAGLKFVKIPALSSVCDMQGESAEGVAAV